MSFSRGTNSSAAHDHIALIEYHSLPGCYRPLRLREDYLNLIFLRDHAALLLVLTVPDFGGQLHR